MNSIGANRGLIVTAVGYSVYGECRSAASNLSLLRWLCSWRGELLANPRLVRSKFLELGELFGSATVCAAASKVPNIAIRFVVYNRSWIKPTKRRRIQAGFFVIILWRHSS